MRRPLHPPGRAAARLRRRDIVEQTFTADEAIHATALTPSLPATIRELAELDPDTLASMHGASYGDCHEALHALADAYLHRLENSMP